MSGDLGARTGPGFQLHLIPNNQGFLISGPGMQIHGNPGDYAWGRGGLDAIVTQLLNQMDGAGPPPMAQENIQDIPTVGVSQVLLDKNPNCSVCWEDFKLEEQVKQLECQHCFHNDCIVPWLQLHGTCPVCRKVLSGETAARPEGERGAGGGGGGAGGREEQDDEEEEQEEEEQEEEDGGRGADHHQHQQQPSGLAGLIQSAIQVLGGTWAGGAAQARGAGSPTSTTASSSAASMSAATSTSTSTSSSQQQQPSTSQGRGVAAPHHQEDEEEGTPSSRRPRYDSDLIDFDPE